MLKMYCWFIWDLFVLLFKGLFLVAPVIFLLACILPILFGVAQRWNELLLVRSLFDYVEFFRIYVVTGSFMSVLGAMVVIIVSVGIPVLLVIFGVMLSVYLWGEFYRDFKNWAGW